MWARNLYHSGQDRSRVTDGQFDPVRLGELICQRARKGEDRELRNVRIYCGLANRRLDPKTHQARSRQAAAWRRAGATVVTRPLQYPRDPQTDSLRAREKGIDVQIAVDFVAMAVRREYDVGIIFSADTDLRPPLEFVTHNYPKLRAEVAAWRSGRDSRRLNFDAPYRTWRHYLSLTDYE